MDVLKMPSLFRMQTVKFVELKQPISLPISKWATGAHVILDSSLPVKIDNILMH